MSSNQDQYEHWKRNFTLLVLDSTIFMTAISFSDISVISVFIKKITGLTFLAGLLHTLRTAAFFIPQILSINIAAKPSKKAIFLKWSVLGRSCLVFAVIATFFTHDVRLVVLSFFLSLTLFPIFDGFTVIPWLELVARSIPPVKRGSFFGLSQSIGAIGTMVGGFLVSKILSDPTFTFPVNYGMLILIELVLMLCGIPFIILLKETPDAVIEEKRSLLERLRDIPPLVREDETVRTLIVVQLLISFYMLATPFYSVYALSRLRIEEGYVGLFLMFQMSGRFVFSFLWAYLCNRKKSKQIIQYTATLCVISLIFAIVVGAFQFASELVRYWMMLPFFILGGSMGGIFLGINNYIMGMAEHSKRPFLLGLFNFLNVTTSIFSLIGGLIIEYLPYEAVFLIAIIPISIGIVLSRRLKQY